MAFALVSYGNSSDDSSESDDNEETICLSNNASQNNISSVSVNSKIKESDRGDQILFNKLPAPKVPDSNNIVEENDEFLQKKPTKMNLPRPPKVQITIPSLSSFKDVDEPKNEANVIGPTLPSSSKKCSLLNMLPKPRQDFSTAIELEQQVPSTSTSTSSSVRSTSLIPDSIRNKKKTRKDKIPVKLITQNYNDKYNDSDDSGEENEDFFSLNKDEQLPAVSDVEINAMVAKRAAEMSRINTQIDEYPSLQNVRDTNESPMDIQMSRNVNTSENHINEEAIQVLVGSRAKRRREELNIVDLSTTDVLPNKEEWLRTAIASSTTYQPRGVLSDEELIPGTRKKHQITYLAHQAKSNEMELQAMWSANRHNRRQTQNKYGF